MLAHLPQIESSSKLFDSPATYENPVGFGDTRQWLLKCAGEQRDRVDECEMSKDAARFCTGYYCPLSRFDSTFNSLLIKDQSSYRSIRKNPSRAIRDRLTMDTLMEIWTAKTHTAPQITIVSAGDSGV